MNKLVKKWSNKDFSRLGSILSFPLNYFKSFKSILVKKKDVIEVISKIALGVAGLIVSYNSIRTSNQQLEIHKASLHPEFKLAYNALNDTTTLFKTQLDVHLTSGYADKISGKAFTFLTLSMDTNGRHVGYDLASKKIIFPVKYYGAFRNKIGTEGKLSFYSQVDLNRLNYFHILNFDLKAPIHYGITHYNGKKYFSAVNLITIISLKYSNVLSDKEQQLFVLNGGGFEISESFFNRYFVSRCNIDSTTNLSDFSFLQIDSIINHLVRSDVPPKCW